MSVFKGAGVAIVTPMNDDETVNYTKLEELINYQIDNGTDAIIIAGTTGESPTLSMEEHREIIKACVDFTKHRIPVIAGTGSNCTKTAIQLTTEAEESGADGCLLVTPYYNKCSQAGLIAHYTAIANSTKLPLILYNVPSRTGVNILPETAATLFKNVENVVGIKEATGSVAQATKLMDLTDGKIDLYSGEDGLVLPLMAIGGVGVISVWSNIAPRDVHDLCMAVLEGDYAKARALQIKGRALVDALFSDVNPIPVKTAMNELGMGVGPLRMPLSPMSDAAKDALMAAVKAYGI